MFGMPMDYQERLNLPEQIARIDRLIEEGHKFTAEQHKLSAEQLKFGVEQLKLSAEGRKFNRDPWMLIAGAIIAGIFTRLPEILHVFGLHP